MTGTGMSALFDLRGTVAVVTGASRGIGFAMAAALAGAGADIIGVSASIHDETDIAHHVRSLGRTFTPRRVDFSRRADVEEFAASMAAAERVPDILVNNAGIIHRAVAADHPTDAWDEVLEVNLSAPFVITRTVGARMLERGSGRVLFTASLLSFQGGVSVPGYAASKSAIAGLTRALSNEWAGRGVTVNAIAPGYIETDNTAPLRANATRSRAILDRIPMGRWGTPSDVAGATVFLCSRAADYISGVVLPVDGGWLAR